MHASKLMIKNIIFRALIVVYVLLLTQMSFAQDEISAEPIPFEKIPFLSYTFDDDNLVLKVDYHSGWGYRVVRFKFPDRLALDISFKKGVPKEFQETNFPVYEKIDLPKHYLITSMSANLDDDGVRVSLSMKYPLEFTPTFDDENGILTITIPLRYLQEEIIPVRKGIEYRKVVHVDDTGPRILHLTYIDTTSGRYFPAILTAKDYDRKFLPIKSMVEKSGAVCASTGGFYSGDGNNQGLIIRKGRLESYPKFNRPVFAQTIDGGLHIGNLPFYGVLHGPNGQKYDFDAVDATPEKGQMVLLTPGHPSRISSNLKGSKIVIKNYKVEYVTTEKVKSKKWRYILWSPEFRDDFKQLKVGDEIELEFGLGISGVQIVDAIGAGPMLISNGKVSISKNKGFRNDIMRGRAPRTGIGLTQDGTLILAMVEGRNPYMGKSSSIGATMHEFAKIMIEYGAVVAMNLDGGGSAAMVIDDKTVSYYPGGSRAVTNSIAIFDKMDFE